jgi:hypothetical protein
MPRIDRPEPGFYKTRLCKGGPFVGAKIYLQKPQPKNGGVSASDGLCCVVAGQVCDTLETWPWLAGNPITREQYVFLEHKRLWAERSAPWEALAHPRKAITWR